MHRRSIQRLLFHLPRRPHKAMRARPWFYYSGYDYQLQERVVSMNHIRWAAWGVVDIEALERMQRRNYIKRARAELVEKGITLNCGGSKATPWYGISLPKDEKGQQLAHAVGGDGA